MPAALMRGHDRERKGKRIMRLEVAGKEWAARGEGSSGETAPATEPRARALALGCSRGQNCRGCGVWARVWVTVHQVQRGQEGTSCFAVSTECFLVSEVSKARHVASVGECPTE